MAKNLNGIGGFVTVFLGALVLGTVLLFLGLGILLQEGKISLSLSKSSIASVGIVFAAIANLVAVVAMARKKGSGIPLSQRAIILTFLATLHLSILHKIASTPMLQLVLLATGAMILWMLYLGINMRIGTSHFHVDFSKRIANTYPAKQRVIKLGTRTLYAVIIWVYSIYLIWLFWQVVFA